MKAIGFGVFFWVVSECLLEHLVWPLVGKYPRLVDFYLPIAGHSVRIVISPFFYFVIAISVLLGLKYPYQALKSALMWPLFWPVFSWGDLAWSILTSHGQARLSDGNNFAFVLFDMIMFFLPQIIWSLIIAYLASVTRRGWYRPSLADFKLSLPQKKARA